MSVNPYSILNYTAVVGKNIDWIRCQESQRWSRKICAGPEYHDDVFICNSSQYYRLIFSYIKFI